MIIETKEQYEKLLFDLQLEEYIALDTETEEFSEEKQHAFELALDGLGIYGEKVRAFIPARFLDNRFQSILDTKTCIFHNAKFDLTIIEKQGFDISKIKFEDTMIMSWLLNENRFSHGLKDLAKSVLGVKEDKVTKFKQVTKRPLLVDYGLFPHEFDQDKIDWEKELGKYCIDDAKYTYKLFFEFKPKLEEQELWNEYQKVELPFVLVLRDIELRGIKIDLEYLKELDRKIQIDLVKLQGDIWREAGKNFNISSPKQLSEILFTQKGYSLSEEYLTSTGGNSTNEAALKYLGSVHPEDKMLSALLEFRELFKVHTGFIIGLQKKQVSGVIYTSFKQHGTVTGRLSSSSPNLQQIPSRSDQYDIRKAFVAREGFTFVISDMSQIEFRLAAHFSQDPTLLNAYQEGKDMHQATADLLGCTRMVSKTVNFGLLYGRTAYGMAKGMGMTPEEAEKFIALYFSKFKKLEILIEQSKNTLKKHYAVRTIIKRKRRFPDYAKAKKDHDRKMVGRIERQALNSIIQGSASDIMKLQMRNLHPILKQYNAHILLQIHDEIVVECPIELAEKVSEVVKYEMENVVKLNGVPLVTVPHVSNFWNK